MNPLKMNLKIASNKLKTIRQQNGWTQQHLSDISDISLRTIQRAESTGNTSIETINALSAVFDVERIYWQEGAFTQAEKLRIKTKGWRIAFKSIALIQLVSLLIVWVLVGEISALWLKLLLTFWLILGGFYFVLHTTLKDHGLQSYNDYKSMMYKLRKK